MAESSALNQGILFAPRFVEKYAGAKLLTDPVTAVIELVANSWDAGATNVHIDWPGPRSEHPFRISDDGCGLTEEQFRSRWLTLAYDRVAEQGPNAEFPSGVTLPPRPAFGRNGVGRFAAFCFAEVYIVDTWRDGHFVLYHIVKGDRVPFELRRVNSGPRSGHGTTLSVERARPLPVSASDLRAELGSRFLTDPNFQVSVNGAQVTFSDLPDDRHVAHTLEVPDHGSVRLSVLTIPESDRTTRQHGIAWHVNGRLVGDCSWKNFVDPAFIDGRTTVARRFTFVVQADFLAESVRSDWSGFHPDDVAFDAANSVVCQWIRERLLDETRDRRAETLNRIAAQHETRLRTLTTTSRLRWQTFISKVQEDCPALTDRDLGRLAGILASMELSEAKYGLVQKLHELQPGDLDQLNEILESWTVDTAKEVLGELELRLKLLEELKQKVFDRNADEVQELQPLFERGLWIFGPQFETIEFTSNLGMTRVIQELLGGEVTGSRRRPDFVILPDGTVGLYSYPDYDEEGAEIGVAQLVIVELKRAGVTIGDEQKGQCWRYVRELYERGQLRPTSRVTAFVLGSDVQAIEAEPREERGGSVSIRPLVYQTVIDRAESRLFKLHERVRSAPFLEALREELQAGAEAATASSESRP